MIRVRTAGMNFPDTLIPYHPGILSDEHVCTFAPGGLVASRCSQLVKV